MPTVRVSQLDESGPARVLLNLFLACLQPSRPLLLAISFVTENLEMFCVYLVIEVA